VLGLIPEVAGWKNEDVPQLITRSAPNSSTAEAYRSLRTSIQFVGIDRPLRIVQVTSPNAQEGKTTTLSNLAVVLAQAGQRVVMVCCDLRRPRLHHFFDKDNAVGFTSVLLGQSSLADAVQPAIPGQDHLWLLASGPPPPNPSELLASPLSGEILRTLASEFDLVLVDCPPVLPVTDAAVLAAHVDATVLVSIAGITTGKQLERAIEVLGQVNAGLIGTVLNGVADRTAYGYSYRYGGYGYGPGVDTAGAPSLAEVHAPTIRRQGS
jgi:capsular exopolysaccharide synthesis family protein